MGRGESGEGRLLTTLSPWSTPLPRTPPVHAPCSRQSETRGFSHLFTFDSMGEKFPPGGCWVFNTGLNLLISYLDAADPMLRDGQASHHSAIVSFQSKPI